MNLIILLIIAFVIIVLIAIVLLLYNNKPIILGSSGGVINASSNCAISTVTAPDLTFNPCCQIFGNITNTKYLSTLNLVVSPVAIGFLPICSGFCTGGYDKNTKSCKDLGPNIETGQAEFLSCVNATQPVDCQGVAMPVAISGTQLLYGYSATNLLCTSSGPCGIS